MNNHKKKHHLYFLLLKLDASDRIGGELELCLCFVDNNLIFVLMWKNKHRIDISDNFYYFKVISILF